MKKLIQITIFAFLILLIRNHAYANIDPLNVDYSKVDNHALSVKIKKSTEVTELAEKLTKPFSTDIEKARAIFRWVAENIAYDTKGFHSSSNKGYSFSYSSEEELQRLLKEKDIEISNETIKKGAGVCNGYATLFKTLCDETGLESVLVSGYARIDPNRLGIVDNAGPNHAWNAIKINNKWYLLDATWASGYTDPGVTKFTKDFNNRYYLTSPEIFALDHFPEDGNWQLLPKKMTKNEFCNIPLIRKGFHNKEITDFSPKEGKLNVKKGEAFTFSFKTDKKVSGVTVAKHTDKFADSANLIRKGDEYSFSYYFQKKGTHIFNIFLDYQQTLVYKVVVK